ncbi:MAG: BrnT family toxin, partial [Candidatus Paceibacterota bacterium]
GRTEIEYDSAKELLNRRKHGYSLESATYLLQRVLLPIGKRYAFFTSEPRETNGEIRHNHLTIDDDGTMVMLVTTMRPNEKVRVISMRKANPKERLIYIELCRNVLRGSYFKA